MSTRKVVALTLFVVLALVLGGFALVSHQADPVEVERIQAVILESYRIEAQAARAFDTSRFASVFVNDWRGGRLGPTYISLVKAVQPHKAPPYGYLDYKLAYYQWWEAESTRLETLFATAKAENRDLTHEESASLVDSDGRAAMFRLQGEPEEPVLRFSRTYVVGNVAIAVFDDGPRTNRMILVKMDGQWLIAGNKIISIHA